MNNNTEFWKSRSGKDFLILISIFLCLSIFFTLIFDYLVITPNKLPSQYLIVFYLPIFIIIILLFLAGLLAALLFPPVLTKFSTLFMLNNVSFSDSRKKLHFVYLVLVTSVLLLTIYIYFISLKFYDPIRTLLTCWLVLIFVRAAHYVDYDLGDKVSVVIISFLIPFGLFIGAITFLETGLSIFSNIYENCLFILYFIMIISAQMPLEVLLEYIGKKYSKKNHKLKKEKIIELKDRKKESRNLIFSYPPLGKCPLTISEWMNYLSSLRNNFDSAVQHFNTFKISGMAYSISLGALLVTIIIGINNAIRFPSEVFIILLIFTLLLTIGLFTAMSKYAANFIALNASHRDGIQSIISLIISGELTEPNKIRECYYFITNKQHIYNEELIKKLKLDEDK